MSVKQRIKDFAKSKGLSIRQFEIQSGLSNGLINNITESISRTTLDKISNSFPDLDEAYILTGTTTQNK